MNRTWLTLQSVFNQIILCNGDNDYNIKHLSKEKLEQTGQLPNELDVVDEANAFDQLYIPHSPDNDMDETDMETNQTNPFEHENTNNMNDDTNPFEHENTNDTNDDTIPIPKRIPILPTCKWEDGGYGQWLSPYA